MKRRIIVGTGVFFILIAMFFIWTFLRRDVYFSNSDSQETTTEYFNIENTLTPDPSRTDTSILEVGLSFKDKNDARARRNSLEVYPIIKGGPSLQQFSNMASHYYFKVPNSKLDNPTLDLLIKFKLDSSNKIIDKSISFKGLKAIKIYRWNAALH
jgi:hypothetical protein